MPATVAGILLGEELVPGVRKTAEHDSGRTELGRGMYPPAMDLTSPHVQNWTDAELFWIIQNGVRLTGMPSWASSISETDTWKLAHLIHQLPRLNEQNHLHEACAEAD